MTSDDEANPANTDMDITTMSRKISGNVALARRERLQDEDVNYVSTGGVTFSH